MIGYNSETIRVNNVKQTTELDFLTHEIHKFINSPVRRQMLDADRYYNGVHDILKRKRTVIGKDGEPEAITNLPNNRLIDNQYSKLVDQKINYVLGKEPIITGDDAEVEAIKKALGSKFHGTLKNVCKDVLNGGLCWLYVYYNEQADTPTAKARWSIRTDDFEYISSDEPVLATLNKPLSGVSSGTTWTLCLSVYGRCSELYNAVNDRIKRVFGAIIERFNLS